MYCDQENASHTPYPTLTMKMMMMSLVRKHDQLGLICLLYAMLEEAEYDDDEFNLDAAVDDASEVEEDWVSAPASTNTLLEWQRCSACYTLGSRKRDGLPSSFVTVLTAGC